MASSRIATAVSLACALFAAACANDTGRPRNSGGDTDFGDNVGVGFAGAGSMPPFVAPPMMTAPMQPPNIPVTPTTCEAARQAANGIVSDDCVACTCRLTPPASNECDADCWRLLVCATTNCAPEDVNCLIDKCTVDVGGLSMLAIAGASARAMPFMDCAAFCVVDDHSEAGPTNDF